MTESDDQKRDEVLKRLLQTPPQPKGGKPGKEGEEKKRILNARDKRHSDK